MRGLCCAAAPQRHAPTARKGADYIKSFGHAAGLHAPVSHRLLGQTGPGRPL